METFFPKKSPKFFCTFCQTSTNNKKDFDKHLLTAKHAKLTKVNTFLPKNPLTLIPDKNAKFICNFCYKEYSRTGLWKHKKTCNNDLKDNNDIQVLTKTVLEVVQQNKELTKQICELSKEKSVTNNINNSNNKNFNINIFLNEQCKNALNITDFVNSLQPQIQDLEETGRLGFVQGISRIFINGLNQLDVHQRPLHCSDFKRETIYIKDSNEWTKENENKDKLTTAIKKVAHKNLQQIQTWQLCNPLYSDPESKQNDKYMKIVYESMSGSTKEESDKNYNKIIKNIAKETVIEK
jgi:hypothetical protein